VVEVAEINFCIGVGCQLILGLGDEKFMLGISEKLAFICVQVDVITVDFGGGHGVETITALDTNLDIVVLECNEGECLCPVFPKEEGDHEVVTTVVRLDVVGSHSGGSLRCVITEEGVVNTLNEEGIELGNLLSTNPEAKLCGA